MRPLRGGRSRPAGPRRVESATWAAQAARLTLDAADRAALDQHLGSLAAPPRARARTDREVVLIAGLSGAGKSTRVAELVDAGYQRLNRDQRGGTLAALAAEIDRSLAAGASRVVLDNTYVTRASR